MSCLRLLSAAGTLIAPSTASAAWIMQDKHVSSTAHSYLGLDVDLSSLGTYAMAGGGNAVQIFSLGPWNLYWPSSTHGAPPYAHGPAVAVAEEGHALLGAPSVDNTCFFAHTSTWSRATDWSQNGTGFGYSVDIDGSTAVIGAPYFVNSRGSVWVMKLSSNGTTWLLGQDIYSPYAGSGRFGSSVAILGDYIAIGALEDGVGAVYVYRKNGSSWTLEAELRHHSPGTLNAGFGSEVDLGRSRGVRGSPYIRLIVGAQYGKAHIYTRDSASGVWDAGVEFMLNGAGAQTTDQSKSVLTGAVAIHDDIAAFGAEDDSKVILYRLSKRSWKWEAVLSRPGGERFGAAVDLAEGVLMVGAPSNDEDAANGGAIYFYGED